MRGSVKLATLTALCMALAGAETWSGKLLDTTCMDQQRSENCDATSATVAFAIHVSGKTYLLDDAGNGKAVEAILARGQDPTSLATAAALTARIDGQLEGEVIKVESIKVQ